MNLLLLHPVRLVALLTIRTTSWGTRADVEVRLDVAETSPSLAVDRLASV